MTGLTVIPLKSSKLIALLPLEYLGTIGYPVSKVLRYVTGQQDQVANISDQYKCSRVTVEQMLCCKIIVSSSFACFEIAPDLLTRLFSKSRDKTKTFASKSRARPRLFQTRSRDKTKTLAFWSRARPRLFPQKSRDKSKTLLPIAMH